MSAGEPVLDIGDMDSLEVQVDLLSMDAIRVRPGMRVLIERWSGDETLEGSVRRVDVGARSGMAAHVDAGVEAGERVVAYPGDRISDGVAVRVR